MTTLFSPFKLRGLTLPNRIMVAPMCQYSAQDGAATSWHFIHIGNLALSGAACSASRRLMSSPRGRITPGCLGLWDDATEAALHPILAAVRQHSKIAVAMQLAHAGRKASSDVPWKGGQQIPLSEGGWVASAPSAVAYKAGETPPVALDAAGLEARAQGVYQCDAQGGAVGSRCYRAPCGTWLSHT